MKAELVLGNLKREREALDNKLERLETALSKEWQDEDQEYLCTQQYNAMCLYAHILDERIINIEYKLEQKRLKNQDIKSHETCHETNDVFNQKINTDSCKEYTNNNSKDNCCEDDLDTIVLQLIKDLFGDDDV